MHVALLDLFEIKILQSRSTPRLIKTWIQVPKICNMFLKNIERTIQGKSSWVFFEISILNSMKYSKSSLNEHLF